MADADLAKSLVDAGLVTEDQLAIARESQKNLGNTLEQVLVDKGFVTEEQIMSALAKSMNTTFVSLSKYKMDPDVINLLPVALAKKHRAIPLFKIENKIVIATSNPLNLTGLDDIRSALGTDVNAVLALDSDIDRAIEEHYRGVGLTEDLGDSDVEIMGEGFAEHEAVSTEDDLRKISSGQKVIIAVNNIIAQAFRDKSSDIHIEPSREEVRVRFRIDGVLEEFSKLPKSMHLPVVSRIKIIGGMDVAERRVPQDGRVRVKISGHEMDMRIATYPTMFGEAAAIRLLTGEQLMTLTDLGFLEQDLDVFRQLISRPHGILLVTGPTGSGKTTTLYASLMEINSEQRHILSVEDPIEHEIPGVDQQQVNVKSGMTFAASLRAMLRQDPDVIMVGEIRDQETAEISIRAAMTGHYVFSTLHTNSAAGAIARLVDIGVEPYLVASTLSGVMAQRLVRKLCDKCKVPDEVPPEKLRRLGSNADIKNAFTAKGCKECRNTGFKGRIGLFEIIPVNDEVRVLINKQLPEVRIKEKVTSMGYHSLLEDGIKKINMGVTSVEEVLKVATDI